MNHDARPGSLSLQSIAEGADRRVHDTSRLLDAIAFASEKHANQRRKDADATPYINHPLAVARLLAVEGGIDDVDVLIAAILHDTLEDTQTTPEELKSRFGQRVAAIVEEVTDDKTRPKDIRKQFQIEHAPHKSPEAALVKIADKTLNLRDVADAPPHDWSLERRREYFEWAKQVVDRLSVSGESLRKTFENAYERRP